ARTFSGPQTEPCAVRNPAFGTLLPPRPGGPNAIGPAPHPTRSPGQTPATPGTPGCHPPPDGAVRSRPPCPLPTAPPVPDGRRWPLAAPPRLQGSISPPIPHLPPA